MKPIHEICGPIEPAEILNQFVPEYRPVVIRNQFCDWPAVKYARNADESLSNYLSSMDSGRGVGVLVGPPEIEGRFFYDKNVNGFNYQVRSGALSDVLKHLLKNREAIRPDAVYLGAAVASEHLTRWAEENPFSLPGTNAHARVWVGNRIHVATHMDETHNIAAVVAGRRRFTLFPPDQLRNLYVGPLHHTIAGPPVSMVDLIKPDLDRYPLFEKAMCAGLFAELDPGDAIFIPGIWWHNVQSLSPFNVMVNYWWNDPEATSGLDTLIRGITSMRDLTPAHRAAWKYWFEQFVFDDDAAHIADHLPEQVRGYAGARSKVRSSFLRRTSPDIDRR